MALAAMTGLPPAFWICLVVVAILLLLVAWRLKPGWRPALPARVFLAALALAGLFLIGRPAASGDLLIRQVLVIDQSDSLGDPTRLEIAEQARAWQAGSENRIVIAFGTQPAVILPGGSTAPEINGRASDAPGAIRLAAGLLGQTPGRIILASDGRNFNPEELKDSLRLVQEKGHRLDVIPLRSQLESADGYAGALSAPANLWEGTPFDVTLPVNPPGGQGQAHVELKINGQPSGLDAELVSDRLYQFHLPPQPEGVTTLEATVSFDPANPDAFPANNSTFATLQVVPAPRVLVVTSRPEAQPVAGWVQALSGTGLQVDTVPPEQLPLDVPALETYRVIFIHDVMASRLSQEQI